MRVAQVHLQLFFQYFRNFRSNYLYLNESNYDEHPGIFSVKYEPYEPDLNGLEYIPGLYECVTINPLGFTKPGLFNGVRSITIIISR